MKTKLLISFSGGRTSAFMTQWLLKNKSDQFDMIVVFANTGKEREETLRFVDLCDKAFSLNVVWVEAVTNPIHGQGVRAKIVNFETASRNGEPYEAMIAKHGIPSANSPHCTRELKKYAIQAYARSIGWKNKDYLTAIGIRTDEADRIKKGRFVYPLISMIPMSKLDINTFWSEQVFDLQLKGYEGNCNKCFKKSLRKLMTIEVEEVDKDFWWDEMEEKYDHFIPLTKQKGKIKPPLRFYRGNLSISKIRKMAHEQPFEKAVDDSKIINIQKSIPFGTELHELDVAGGCSESCEVF